MQKLWHDICVYNTSFTSYNQEAIGLLIEGIVKARSINLKEIVVNINSSATPDSEYRKFQRLFQKEMELCGIGIFVLRSFLELCLNFLPSPVKLYLSIDRHEWKFGAKANNLLVAHIYEPITGIDFPVSVIDLDRCGNSSNLDRYDLIDHVILFLKSYIDNGSISVTLLGDREFFSHDFTEQLESKSIGYNLRLRRNYKLLNDQNVEQVYRKLNVNESVSFSLDNQVVVIKKLESIPGRRDDCLAVLSDNIDNSLEDILDEYSIRWKIERSFFNLESNGWQLSKTHLKHPKRIEMMFYVLVLCYYLSVLSGYMVSKFKKIKIKKHGYKAISFFLRGRRLIEEYFTRHIVNSFCCLMKLLEELLAKMLDIILGQDAYSAPSQGVV